MAKYRVTQLSYIDKQLHEEGAEIDFDGIPGSALEPICDDAKAAKAKALAAKGIKPAKAKTLPTVLDAGEEGEEGAEIGNADDLDALKAEYKVLFNKAAHHNASAKTIREAIAAERQRLGA